MDNVEYVIGRKNTQGNWITISRTPNLFWARAFAQHFSPPLEIKKRRIKTTSKQESTSNKNKN